MLQKVDKLLQNREKNQQEHDKKVASIAREEILRYDQEVLLKRQPFGEDSELTSRDRELPTLTMDYLERFEAVSSSETC